MAVILIVEDEEQVRVLAELYLQEQGHQTVSAATAEEALAALEVAEQVDLLFTDIGLHGDLHAGLVLAKQAVERRPELKVLYTTGQGVTDGMRAMFVKASALLPKPYTVDQLQRSLADNFGIESRRLNQARPSPDARAAIMPQAASFSSLATSLAQGPAITGRATSQSASAAVAIAPSAENDRGIAEAFGDDAADGRAQRRADALQRHHRTKSGIDPAGAGEDARHQARHCHAQDAGADAIKNLHRAQSPWTAHQGRSDAAHRQRDERDQKDEPIAAHLGKPRRHERHRNHGDLAQRRWSHR